MAPLRAALLLPAGEDMTTYFAETFGGGADGQVADDTNTNFTGTNGAALHFDADVAGIPDGSTCLESTATVNARLLAQGLPATATPKLRLYFRRNGLPSTNTAIVQLKNAAGTQIGDVRLTTTGAIQVRRSNTAIVTSSVITDQRWCRIEVDYDDLAASGAARLRVYQGAADADAHGTTPASDTTSGTGAWPDSAFTWIDLGVMNAQTGLVAHYDAVAIGDTVNPGPVSSGPAPPTVVGVGAAANNTAAAAPGMPAGVQQGDLLVCLIETAQQAVPLSDSIMLGWSEFPSTPVVTGTATTGSRLTMRYKFAGPSEPATVSVGDSGDHQIARIIAFRGVPRHLDPWDILATTVGAAGNATATWPAVTTTVADCLILLAIATGRDINSTANLGAVTNAALSALTERMDDWTAAGGGGGIGAVTGLKATAGDTGASTATMGSTDAKLLATVALRPPPPAPSPIRVVGIVTSLDISGQSITIPTGTLAAGETAVAWVCTDAGGAAPGSVTPPDGTWTQRAGQFEDIGDVVHAVYTKPISGAPPATYTFSGHAGGSDGWGVLFAVEAGYEFDIAGAQSAAGTTLTAPAVTATGAGRALRLYAHHPRAAGPTRRITAVPATELLRVTDDNYNLLAASSDAVAAAGSTGTQAATADNSHTWRAITLHFKTAAGGPVVNASSSVAGAAQTSASVAKRGQATSTATGAASTAATGAKTAARAADLQEHAQIDSAAATTRGVQSTTTGAATTATQAATTRSGQNLLTGQAQINTATAAPRQATSAVAGTAALDTTPAVARAGAAEVAASAQVTSQSTAPRAHASEIAGAAQLDTAAAAPRAVSAQLEGAAQLDTATAAPRAHASEITGAAQTTSASGAQIGAHAALSGAAQLDTAAATARTHASEVAGSAQVASAGGPGDQRAYASEIAGSAQTTAAMAKGTQHTSTIAASGNVTSGSVRDSAGAARIEATAEITADAVTERGASAELVGAAAVSAQIGADPPVPVPSRTTAARGRPVTLVGRRGATQAAGRRVFQPSRRAP